MANKIWNSNIGLEERKQIIDRILDFQKENDWFDDSDLAYYVKMLLESGKVYVSENALKVIKTNDPRYTRFSQQTIKKWEDGNPVCDYLQNKTHNTRKLWGESFELVWEHVVPTNVLIKMMKAPPQDLSKIIEKGIVCIVLKYEDDCLTKLKIKDKMPKDWNRSDLWARYKKAGIKVVGVNF